MSAVAFPAYPDTEIALRSFEKAKDSPKEEKQAKREGYALRKAILMQRERGIK